MPRSNMPTPGPVSQPITGGAMSYTPVITKAGATFASSTGFWKRIPGGLLFLWGKFSVSTSDGLNSIFTITLPYTPAIDSIATGAMGVGGSAVGFIANGGNTTAAYNFISVSTGAATLEGSNILQVSTVYSWHATIPILA